MKSKNKIVTIAIILTTLVLAGIAIFTAIRLYQTRNVAPTSSEAAGVPKACKLSFTITGATPTATATPLQCNSVCTSDSQCGSGLKCLATSPNVSTKRCRKVACPSDNDCVCNATTTPTATATATPQVAVCNEVCNVTINPPISCEGELSCYSTSGLAGASGVCRNLDCVEETDCGCPGATETPTATPTEAPTATATATANPQCNNSCTENTDCPNGLMCNIPSGATSGSCRNTSCLSETDCLCPVATGTSAPVAEEPELPEAGTSWPTVLGTAFGFLVILGSLLLVF